MPRRRSAALACALLLLLVPGTALGHAELVETSPRDGAVLDETPVEVTATFSEALVVESSAITLRTVGGEAIAEGTASGREPEILRVAPPPTLAPGTYEVRWVAASDDEHIERGSFRFTIAAASPSPSPPASASPSPSPSPSAVASPSGASPSPSPSAGPAPPDSAAASAAGPIIAALVALAIFGLWLMRRRR